MFAYPCPSCLSTAGFHGVDCSFEESGITMEDVRKAYIDILGPLHHGPKTKTDLREYVADLPEGQWSREHSAALDTLEQHGHVKENFDSPTTDQLPGVEVTDDGAVQYVLLTAEERVEEMEPGAVHPDLGLIWENGPVDGAKDAAVFSMVSWCEFSGFSWEQTQDRVRQWLRRTGGWERGSWEERSIDELLQKKKHIYDNSYGWKKAAQEAAAVIGRRSTGGSSTSTSTRTETVQADGGRQTEVDTDE